MDASLAPSEGGKEESLHRSVLDGHAIVGRFSKVVEESLSPCHLSEASGISQEWGCLGTPAALSPGGRVARTNTAVDFRAARGQPRSVTL